MRLFEKSEIRSPKSEGSPKVRSSEFQILADFGFRISDFARSFFLFCIIVLPTLALASNIANTKHNLSVSGPGPLKAANETDLCLFCHTIHRTTGQTPLWSHAFSQVTNYIVYSSPTLKATVGQPDGSSRLCLSCHDGTVALGNVSSRAAPITMQNSVSTMPTGPGNLGTDLSGDHPISFVYDQNLASLDNQIKSPSTIDPKLKLDPQHKLQCVTCHDPHDNQFGDFLVMDNTSSALCTSCHVQAGWAASIHNSSSAQMAAIAASQLNTTKVAGQTRTASSLPPNSKSAGESGCQMCHTSHKAGSKARLLIHGKEEQNCFVCHNGKVLPKNLSAEFNKISVHPVLQTSSTHSLAEDVINSPRHAACADCHNSHASLPQNAPGVAATRKPIVGVKGVSSSGAVINPATREYELCFRCHAESPNRVASHVNRQFVETNKRLQFRLTNQSSHPLEGAGRNPNVPSLIAPWTTSSTVTCTDCHNNDQGIKAGGGGPDGPHGSAFTPILERQLQLSDNNPETPGIYALCYKCHSRSSILSDQSFRATSTRSQTLGQPRGHQFHIVTARAACTTCHDSHGVEQQANLINFNRDYVSPASTGRLDYLGGVCTLTCHGDFPGGQIQSEHIAFPASNSRSAAPSVIKKQSLPR
jgi:predicted CXXCH cytochrome family protein